MHQTHHKCAIRDLADLIDKGVFCREGAGIYAGKNAGKKFGENVGENVGENFEGDFV